MQQALVRRVHSLRVRAGQYGDRLDARALQVAEEPQGMQGKRLFTMLMIQDLANAVDGWLGACMALVERRKQCRSRERVHSLADSGMGVSSCLAKFTRSFLSLACSPQAVVRARPSRRQLRHHTR